MYFAKLSEIIFTYVREQRCYSVDRVNVEDVNPVLLKFTRTSLLGFV